MKITHEQLKNLSDEQLIRIANVIEQRDDWSVSKKYTEEQNIYEILPKNIEDVFPGNYNVIIQILFGQESNGGYDGRYLIRYFDVGFFEGSPTNEELKQIINIIND